jgi:hypothetical protein
MLILEKFRNKYHQIWIMVDGEKRDGKFDCRLKGEKQTILHSNRPGPAPSLATMVSLPGSPLSVGQSTVAKCRKLQCSRKYSRKLCERCRHLYTSILLFHWYILNFEGKFRYPNYVAKSISRFLEHIWCY